MLWKKFIPLIFLRILNAHKFKIFRATTPSLIKPLLCFKHLIQILISLILRLLISEVRRGTRMNFRATLNLKPRIFHWRICSQTRKIRNEALPSMMTKVWRAQIYLLQINIFLKKTTRIRPMKWTIKKIRRKNLIKVWRC